MNVDYILNKARKSLSSFCVDECRAFCCRKCYLVLDKDQVDTVTQCRSEELKQKGMLLPTPDGRYSLNMGSTDMPCPSLKDFKCTIHNNKKRSKTCSDYPIFISGMNIMLSPRCLAVKQGKLYPYTRKLHMLGYKFLHADEYSDVELYNKEFKNDPDLTGCQVAQAKT
ncbi:MAG: hypothetical protein V1729_05630 [Candidatus Woesearchaeota archaeon]